MKVKTLLVVREGSFKPNYWKQEGGGDKLSKAAIVLRCVSLPKVKNIYFDRGWPVTPK